MDGKLQPLIEALTTLLPGGEAKTRDRQRSVRVRSPLGDCFARAPNSRKASNPSGDIPHLRCTMSNGKSRSLLALAGFGLATAGAACTVRATAQRKAVTPGTAISTSRVSCRRIRFFPIVETSLYAMIAWSGWRIWNAAPSRERKHALRLWISQLGANAKWSKLFFGQHRPRLALADVIALGGNDFFIHNGSSKSRSRSGQRVYPFAAWVAFATVLNSEIVRLNPRQT